jgi:PIN domain nuclease of toxin-antitoxin system
VILLDTCALLWLAHDQTKLSPEALRKIDKSPVLFVSAISGFEVGLKYRASKLSLPVPPREWFEGVLRHHDISILDLDMEICLKASGLPPIHRDPCDRFIIATALVKGIPVMTADTRFKQYGVHVLD